VAAYEWLLEQTKGVFDRDVVKRLKTGTYFGEELVPRPRRLSLMNLYLHGIEPHIRLGDSIYEPPASERFDVILDDSDDLPPPEELDLVAGVLRAMGYRTTVSAPGADRGVDIFASPDGLGLQEPRIFVEVKHRNETTMGAEKAGSQAIDAFT